MIWKAWPSKRGVKNTWLKLNRQNVPTMTVKQCHCRNHGMITLWIHMACTTLASIKWRGTNCYEKSSSPPSSPPSPSSCYSGNVAVSSAREEKWNPQMQMKPPNVMAVVSSFHRILYLPQKVTLRHHQILCLPRKVTLRYHQMLRLPRKVTLRYYQILRLPRKVRLLLNWVVTKLLLSCY